jgi:hypothetical protein
MVCPAQAADVSPHCGRVRGGLLLLLSDVGVRVGVFC